MTRAIPFTFFFLFLWVPAAHADWHFAWQQDAVTGDPSCSASTDPQPVWPGSGSAETAVMLGVQADGLITIRSDPAAFDPAALDGVGIAVDDYPPVPRPWPSMDGRTLTFSEEDSATLHRRFEEGRVVRVKLAFAPSGRSTAVTFSLDNYRRMASQFKGCRGLLLNTDGWLGVYMTTVPEDKAWMRWVRANTAYRGSGVRLMTVDPRKEAHRVDLRPGDIVLGVNGAEAEVPSFMRVLKGLGPGGTAVLDVARDQVMLKKTLVRPPIARPAQETR